MASVLRVAFPLVLASSGHALRLFADRVMLSHYSPAAIAAAMPAGLMCFCFMSFFIGTASYANSFVAQYTGAGRAQRAGLAVWQALYLSVIGGIVVAMVGNAGEMIFAWAGHAPDVQVEQVRYFRVLTHFGFAGIMLSSLNAFWSGRGKTRVVMAIELSSAGMNIVLNGILIFGKLGFPRLGIYGAGLATGLSSVFGLLLAFSLFLAPHNRREFGTLPKRTLNPALLGRLLRYGLPNGFQFMLDLVAFNLFIVFMGRLGSVELEAANIAFGLNALAFLPIIGFGMSASILVGQGIGARNIAGARHAVHSAVAISWLYNAAIGAVFVFWPDPILALFVRPNDPAQVEVLRMTVVCLRFITAYLFFDSLFIVFSYAIKGAGDTRFAMITGSLLSWGTLVLPCYIALRCGAGAWTLWSILVAHVSAAGIVFYLRYRGGRWQSMRIIEPEPSAPVKPESTNDR